jgi:uncharacterized protein
MDTCELRQKAESGSLAAQTVLGISYLEGIDVEIDYDQALRFLSLAADRGASRAIVNLARMYAAGLGVERDVPRAINLYESVGEAEFLAAIELGRIYSQGQGVPADAKSAMRWYSTAAAWKVRVEEGEEMREAARYVTRAF